jgi:gluconate 5-dehydrogenase
MEQFSLKGKTALITGGGSGIGKAIASCMVTVGARVIITGRRQDVLEQTCKELGSSSSFIIHDITQVDGIDEFMARLKSQTASLDILVHNAGNHLKKDFLDTGADELLGILNTHVIGAYALTQAIVPAYFQQGSGSIIFITSMASVFGIPQVSAYSAAKSALAGLTKTLATELSPQGIRVNSIAPGWIETAMTQKVMENDSQRKQKILSRTPLGSFGKPEDIGWAAVYLSCPAARFITGHQLVVDGGISIGF